MGKNVYITEKEIDVIWSVLCFLEDRIEDLDDDNQSGVEEYNLLKNIYDRYNRKPAHKLVKGYEKPMLVKDEEHVKKVFQRIRENESDYKWDL